MITARYRKEVNTNKEEDPYEEVNGLLTRK